MVSRGERTRHRSSTTARYRFDFIDDGERAVVPILKRDRNGIRALVGTGFFVASDGVFATAKHEFTGSDVSPGDAFEVMYCAVDGTISVWPVDSIVPHDDADLAVCALLQPPEREGFVLDHPVVAFMDLVPEFKEVLGTFAFFDTEVHPPVEVELEGELELVRRPPPSQTWRTFLTNHVSQLVSVDFFVVPTLTFRVLFVFVVLAHDRRQIVHVNVTGHPTAAWTSQQLRHAFPWDTAPRFLLRDRDGTYGDEFRACLDAMGIDEVLTAPRSPWQNPYVERLIGSMRRECVDHMMVLNERFTPADTAVVHRLLPELAHASGVGQGSAGEQGRRACGPGRGHRAAAHGRPPPQLPRSLGRCG